MFESTVGPGEGPIPSDPDAAAVRAMLKALASASGPEGVGAEIDAERIDLIRALEDLKNVAVGLQVSLTEAFDASQRAQQMAAGASSARVGQGVAAQVALARGCSPHRGRRQLSLARVLRSEMPSTYAALRAGRISEYAATLMAEGTVCVSAEDRLRIDAEVAGDPAKAERLGERGIQAEAAKASYRLDPASVVERRRRAEAERCVSLRPAPDTMTYLTALLPVADGVAIYAAVSRAADTARATGTPRTRGQVMADALRDAVLAGATDKMGATDRAGEAGDADHNRAQAVPSERAADAGAPGPGSALGLAGAPAGVGVVLNLIMTERQLFGVDTTSEGEVLIGGPAGGLSGIDADLARQLAALTPADRLWVRRLYQEPTSGELVATDSRQRRFPPGLQRLILFRDQHCRTPWCRAPIRHTDHARRSSDRGPTAFHNGQGLCEACNYGKDAPHWRTEASWQTQASWHTEADAGFSTGPHRITITTPTGHTYESTPPPPPGGAASTVSPDSPRVSRLQCTRRRALLLEIVRDAPPEAGPLGDAPPGDAPSGDARPGAA